MINIDELIQQSIKLKERVKLRAYKNLKAEIQVLKTSKNAKPYDEAAEIQLISRMCKKLEDSILEFSKADREDLISEYREELEVLKKLLPEPVSAQKIYAFLSKVCFEKGYIQTYLDNKAPCPMEGFMLQIPKKEMGSMIKVLKSKLPNADGKMISEIVKKYLV